MMRSLVPRIAINNRKRYYSLITGYILGQILSNLVAAKHNIRTQKTQRVKYLLATIHQKKIGIGYDIE